MSSPEREEVAADLAKEMDVRVSSVTGMWYWKNVMGREEDIPPHITSALISREMRVREMEAALRYIHDTFDRDLQQGFHTNDKAFARDIAGSALNSKT